MAVPHIETKTIPTVENAAGRPEPKADLDSAFDSFFKNAAAPSPEEVKEAEAVVPEEGVEDTPAPETEPLDDSEKEETPKEDKTEEKAPESPKDTQPAPKPDYKPGEAKPDEKKDAPKEEPDELDKLQLPSNARPQMRADFQVLKDKAHAFRAEAKALKAAEAALREEVAKRDKELEDARKAVQSREVPKEVQERITQAEARAKEAEHKVKLLDLKSDKEFNGQYNEPIKKLYSDLLDECIKAAAGVPEEAAIKEWATARKAESPDQYGEAFWEHALANPLWENKRLARERFATKVAQLTNLKMERDQKLEEFQADPNRIDAYQKAKYEEYWGKWYLPAATDEAMKLASKLGEWAQRKDPAKAVTPEEKAAIAMHNETYQAFEDDFKANFQKINDDSENKPRLHAQVALKATQAMKLEKDLAQATADLDARTKALDAKDGEIKQRDEQIKKMQAELDKLTAVRSVPAKATNVTAKPPSNLPAHKLTQSANDAMNEFFQARK